MKKWIAILLIAVMALGLIACGSKGSKGEGIVGTWELTGGEGEEAEQQVKMMLAMGMTMTWTFNADGTGSMKMAAGGQEESQNFEYTLENGEIVIQGQGEPYTLDGDKLTIDMEGTKLVFTRK